MSDTENNIQGTLEEGTEMPGDLVEGAGLDGARRMDDDGARSADVGVDDDGVRSPDGANADVDVGSSNDRYVLVDEQGTPIDIMALIAESDRRWREEDRPWLSAALKEVQKLGYAMTILGAGLLIKNYSDAFAAVSSDPGTITTLAIGSVRFSLGVLLNRNFGKLSNEILEVD